MPKPRPIADPLTRDPDSIPLRYVYDDGDFLGYMQPEIDKAADLALLYWVGRLWRNDADPKESDPLIEHRSDNPWDCGDALVGMADEVRNEERAT